MRCNIMIITIELAAPAVGSPAGRKGWTPWSELTPTNNTEYEFVYEKLAL